MILDYKMKNFKNINFVSLLATLIAVGLLFSACGKKQKSLENNPQKKMVSAEESKKVAESSQAEESKQASSTPFRLPICESEADCCQNDPNCVKQCADLLYALPEAQKKEAQKKCQLLPTEHVQQIQQVMNILRKPKPQEMQNIALPLFWSLLSLSHTPWEKAIRQYTYRQANTVLLWMVRHPKLDPLAYRPLHSPLVRPLLIALFRQKNRKTSLLDDNIILSSLKEPLDWDGGKSLNFFSMVVEEHNFPLLSLVHKEVVSGYICDHPINRPQPVGYKSGYVYSACVLAVYCHVTGSYKSGQYVANTEENKHYTGSEVRYDLAGELNDEEVDYFISTLESEGGLGLVDEDKEWSDLACQKLGTLWNDSALKINL